MLNVNYLKALPYGNSNSCDFAINKELEHLKTSLKYNTF